MRNIRLSKNALEKIKLRFIGEYHIPYSSCIFIRVSSCLNRISYSFRYARHNMYKKVISFPRTTISLYAHHSHIQLRYHNIA